VEFIQAAQWVAVDAGPASFTGSIVESAEFYLNKILVKNKESPHKEHHREFVKLIKSSCEGLTNYIKMYYKSGITWAKDGGDLKSFNEGSVGAAAGGGGAGEDTLDSLLARLEDAVGAVEAKSGGGFDGEGDAPSVVDYNAFLAANVVPLVNACKAIGDDAAAIGDLLDRGFRHAAKFVKAASKSPKPSADDFKKCLDEFGAVLGAVAPDNRSSAYNHQMAFVEFAPIVQWVCVEGGAKGFVQSSLEASDFYLTKVLKDAKDSPKKDEHRAFVKGCKDTANALMEYIQQYHRLGLTYNVKGDKTFIGAFE